MSFVEGVSVGELLDAARQGLSASDLNGLRGMFWGLTLLFFCVGDLVTTQIGLSMQGVVEAGPVVAPVLHAYGVGAMLGLKGATLGLFYGLARLLPEPHSVGVPLGLALTGVFVTGWNLVVLCLSTL